MAQRIHNLSKWRFLEEGKGMAFTSDKQRMVVLDVNCPQETAFYVLQKKEDVASDPETILDEDGGREKNREFLPYEDRDRDSVLTFLGLASGRDRFEFGVEGSFELIVEGGSAYIYTADGEVHATHVVAPVIFTRIANRRQRNPHLEMMMYRERMNRERFERDLLAEIDRRVQEKVEGSQKQYAPQRDIRAPNELVGNVEMSLEEANRSFASGEAAGEGGKPSPEPKGAAKKKSAPASD